MTIQIPAPIAATKGQNGWQAEQYIKLGPTSNDGDATLRIRTYKGVRSIETRYSFGWLGSSRGFETFTCMIMTDYSGKLSHESKRATQKAVTEAHAAAMQELPVRKHIVACVAHQNLEVEL